MTSSIVEGKMKNVYYLCRLAMAVSTFQHYLPCGGSCSTIRRKTVDMNTVCQELSKKLGFMSIACAVSVKRKIEIFYVVSSTIELTT